LTKGLYDLRYRITHQNHWLFTAEGAENTEKNYRLETKSLRLCVIHDANMLTGASQQTGAAFTDLN